MKNFIFALCAMAFLAGCGWIVDDITGRDPRHFRKYFENNETIEEITFTRVVRAFDEQKEPKFRSEVGEAFIKVPFKFGVDYTTSLIGDVVYLGGDMSEIALDLDRKDRGVKFHQMKDAKNIKIYHMGKGILETIVYRSNLGICNHYLQGKGVAAKSVTNYYIDDNNFFATIVEADIFEAEKFNIKRLDYKFSFKQNGEKELSFINHVKSAEFKKSQVDEDLKKQSRILFGLCTQK